MGNGLGKHLKQISIPVCVAFGLVSLSGCALWDRHHEPRPWGTNHRTSMTDQELRQLVASARPFIRNPEMHFRQGLYFQARGQHKLAVDEFAKVLLLKPDHIKTLNAMAVSCDNLQDYEQAVALYKQALSLDPEQDYIYNNLGYSYFLQGNYTAAVEAFQKAVALDESNKIFLNNLGMAYAQKGLFDKALAEFQRDAAPADVVEIPVPMESTQSITLAPEKTVPPQASKPAGVAIEDANPLSPLHESVPTPDRQVDIAQSEPESRHWIRKPMPENPGQETDPALPDPKGLEEPFNTFEPERPHEFEIPNRPEQFQKPREIVVVADSQNQNPAPPAEPSRPEPAGAHSKRDHQPGLQPDQQTTRPDEPAHQPQPTAPTPAPLVAELQSPTHPSPFDSPSDATLSRQQPARHHDFLKAVPVEVLNGNGINRMAHQVGSYLEANGFRVTRKKNADHFDHPRTTIHYEIGYFPAAELLSRQLSGVYLLKEEASLNRHDARIRITVGKDLDHDKMAVLGRRQDEDATQLAASGQETVISRGPDSVVRP
ncbi:LytR C-terminal domain-containing protein [Desulfonatronum parangueonense]